MAVRREVVSLSQLLQRRKTSADANSDQHARLPLSQPTPTGGSRYGPVRQRWSQVPARNSHHLPPSGSQRLQSQSHGAFDAESAPAFSQSQDAFDEGAAFASLSQCSYSQSQNVMQSSQEETNVPRSLPPPPTPLTQKASYQEVNQPSVTPTEQRQLDKELVEQAVGPIQFELALISASLREQAAVSALQLETLKPVMGDVAHLRESVQKLREKNDEVAERYNTCEDKILSEASAISSAIKSLETRFSGVEDQLKGIASNVDDLVQASKQVQVASVDSRRNEANRCKRREIFVDSPAKSSPSQWDGFPIEHDHDIDEWDGAQNRSLHRSLQLIEETRAKRRRTKFFRK